MARGGRREGAGRPRGSPNRVTKEVRAALKKLVEDNVGEMHDWFKRQWGTDEGGKVAANLLSRLIEFAAPKLQRTEHSLQDGTEVKSVDDMSDAELEAIVREASEQPDAVYARVIQGTITADVAAKALTTAAQQDAPRGATGADFGLPEPEPAAQRVLPPTAPPTPPIAPLRLPEPVASTAPPAPAGPVQGEVLEREMRAEIAAAPSRAPTRRMIMAAAFQEYLQRVEQYTAEQRAQRNDPYWTPKELELRLALGPRPPNPSSYIWLG